MNTGTTLSFSKKHSSPLTSDLMVMLNEDRD